MRVRVRFRVRVQGGFRVGRRLRCGERGLLFVAVHGFLIAVASLVAEHGL